ncbi:hypothetical protein BDY19DRAFT_910658 [Irpex rosettiformis]|uniref:Uncharacterized protein n=1 Tax=Irpex rosettiformis TaxID=378272 RepID=A0ACB8TN02_9APHY|nr:hypothetical protein BDY19DRAFT_910658 [Irpex rosettiformis]
MSSSTHKMLSLSPTFSPLFSEAEFSNLHISHPTSPFLPNDIIDLIIRNNPDNAKSCSLVSWEWRSVSLPHLFRSFVVHRTHTHEDPRWLQFLVETPWIAKHVQIVQLFGCSLSIKELDTLLISLPSLRSLDLRVTTIDRQGEDSDAEHIFRGTHSLANLNYSPGNDNAWFNNIVDILLLFSNIDSLHTCDSFLPDPPSRAVTQKAAPIITNRSLAGKLQIRSVHVESSQWSVRYYTAPFLSRIDSLRSISSLSIVVEPENLEELSSLLSDGVGVGLKTLSVTLRCKWGESLPEGLETQPIPIELLRPGLATCVALEKFELKVRSQVSDSRLEERAISLVSISINRVWVASIGIIALVPTRGLRHLGLEIFDYSDADVSPFPWDAMNPLLRSLSGVEVINVVMPSEKSWMWAEFKLRGFDNVQLLWLRTTNLLMIGFALFTTLFPKAAQMAEIHLPDELVEHILTNFSLPWNDLLTCSLVTRQWRTVVSPLLFHSLTLAPHRIPRILGSDDSGMDGIIRSLGVTPFVAAHVKTLSIMHIDLDLASLHSLLSLLPALRYLSLRSTCINNINAISLKGPARRHSIRTLEIESLLEDYPSHQQLAHVLALFSHIGRLMFCDNSEMEPSPGWEDVRRYVVSTAAASRIGRLRVHRLNLYDADCSRLFTMAFLNAVGAFRNLISLMVPVYSFYDGDPLNDVLSACGKTLIKLTMKLYLHHDDFKPADVIPIENLRPGLSACTALKIFSLTISLRRETYLPSTHTNGPHIAHLASANWLVVSNMIELVPSKHLHTSDVGVK